MARCSKLLKIKSNDSPRLGSEEFMDEEEMEAAEILLKLPQLFTELEGNPPSSWGAKGRDHLTSYSLPLPLPLPLPPPPPPPPSTASSSHLEKPIANFETPITAIPISFSDPKSKLSNGGISNIMTKEEVVVALSVLDEQEKELKQKIETAKLYYKQLKANQKYLKANKLDLKARKRELRVCLKGNVVVEQEQPQEENLSIIVHQSPPLIGTSDNSQYPLGQLHSSSSSGVDDLGVERKRLSPFRTPDLNLPAKEDSSSDGFFYRCFI